MVNFRVSGPVGLLPRLLPSLTLLFLLALTQMLPAAIPRLGTAMPFLLAIAVFHWTLETPQWLPSPLVFASGLFHDIATGGPLGLSALSLLLLQGLTSGRSRSFVGKSFIFLWSGFVFITFLLACLSWFVAIIYRWSWIDPGPLMIQWLLTSLIFPPISYGLARLQRWVLR